MLKFRKNGLCRFLESFPPSEVEGGARSRQAVGRTRPKAEDVRNDTVRFFKACAVLFAFLFVTACSEPVTVETREMDGTYLIIEGLLTDDPDMDQYVKLSESVPYYNDGVIPKVSGAEVVVNDGTEDILFTEKPAGSGEYCPPEGFRAELNKKYHLSVTASLKGEQRHYEAEAEMPELGFRVDRIDYTFNGNTKAKLDSLWTVLMWGQDDPETSCNFLVYIAVNGHRIPLSSCLMIEDKYFNGKAVDTFPCGLLSQTADNRKHYGECHKYLEKGDVITLEGYSMKKDFYTFMSHLQGDGGMASMPLLQSQPGNPVTNLKGDGYVLGYFGICSTATASVTVDDPFQTIFYNR